MKKSLLLFSFFSLMLNAQEPYPDYQDQWDKVIGYEMERLPKSALQEVNKIYEQAKTDNNAPQIVKALMFQSKFAMLVEEDSQLKVIHNFEKEIAVADFPARPLLESVLANLYWQYFQENRWRFYRRTETEEKANPGDFRTWDLNTIFKEIHTHFNNALAEPKRLQAYELDAFKSIIERRCDTRPNKPTLYDFIARQALKFYQTDETQLTKPAYKYELDNPILLSDAQTFAQLQLTTKDTLSLQFNALKLFQNLMAFHLKDENPEALVALDLERLNFVNEYAVFKNKEELLLQTLEQSRQKLENYPVSTLYDVEIANILRHKGSNYHYKRNPDNQWFLQQAVAICDRAIERFPDSKGGLSCHNIKTSILAPSFNITAEEYIPVNQDSRVLIQYENIESLDFKVLKIDREKALELKEIYKDSVRLALLKKLPVQTTFNTTLKSVGDYQNHSMEGLVPALPHGMYVLFATLPETSAYAYAVIQVTDLTLIEIENRSDQRMQIVNRVNGSPVAGAKVHLQSVDLNRYDKKLDKTYTTDHNGYIYPSAKNHHDYHVIALVSTAEDKAVFGAYYLSNHGDSSPEKRHTYYQTFVFTDRSIYRPGQKLYFKAIVVENKPDGKLTRSRAFPNADVKVTLKDVNWQEIKTLNLTTNAYGSVAGEFMLPDGGLTGRYYIEIEGKRSRINNIHDISVEEYKRPKFETAFKPVEDTYQVDEQVTVKGEAKALAGTAISEAKVMYRVSREVQYPRWWYWYRPDYYSEPQEITHGETTTDARGIYEIKFLALPDKSVSPDDRPVFYYRVTADVTDINGETRSTETVVNVGYHSLLLNVTADGQWQTTDKTQSIVVNAQNLNGQNAQSTGTLKIFKLRAPEQPKRQRPWEAPDFNQWTQTEFNRLFPYDTYGDNSNVYAWELGEKVFEKSFKTTKEAGDTIRLTKEFSGWTQGQYKIVVTTKDKNTNIIEDKLLFELKNPKATTVADHQLLRVATDKDTYNPGEQVKLSVGSASPDATVYVYVEKDYKITKLHAVKLNNGIKTLKIPVTDGDLGGFAVKYSLVNLNSIVSGVIPVNVEYPKKPMLNFEVATFKDKLQPGSEQTWQFTLKGFDKDRKAAEVLASMYDASLDQFRYHRWSEPYWAFYKRYWTSFGISADKSFGNRSFRVYDLPSMDYVYVPSSCDFDTMKWFGFSLNFNSWRYHRYLNNLTVRQGKGAEKIVAGTVSDETGPLPGANIMIQGTAIETETDFDGKFVLRAKVGDILKVSYVGYKDAFATVGSNRKISIVLETDESLDEVVVTAICVEKDKGMLRKSKANRLAESVVADELEEVVVEEEVAVEEYKAAGGKPEGALGAANDAQTPEKVDLSDVKARTNFQETAFFYPQLLTDERGNITFSFTTPEALTRWKLQLLGHTPDMQTAYYQATTVTQKDLMVQPNPPRFLRQGDKIILSAKISNLTEKTLNGVTQLELTDAVTGENIDAKLSNDSMQQRFKLDAQGNTSVSWTLRIPYDVTSVQYKIVAKAGNFSDGEQNALPVLTNRMLVTESLAMWVNSNETRTFTLDKLKNHKSTTLTNHKLTLEVTSNPVWYAIQALPYLMEYPYECSEQTFSRLYANALATKIVNDNPKIKAVFDQWENTGALLSNLEKNEELKSMLIAETPWLRDAQSETEQKKRIALLFDLRKMSRSLEKASRKLRQAQFSEGGFPWFKGSKSTSRYITQHIVAGFGHLNKLDAWPVKGNRDRKTERMLTKAVGYIDNAIMRDYQNLIEEAQKIRARTKDKAEGERLAKEYMDANHLGSMQLHYLYTRTFYPDISIPKRSQMAVSYFTKQAYKYWDQYALYQKGMIALVAQRNNNAVLAQKIVRSLDEHSTTNEELGMYWKANQPSWYWYQAPIETQALLIETFAEVKPDVKQLDLMKMWLLKNKQTNRWATTKATTEAVYALLAYGHDWTANETLVEVRVGGQEVSPEPDDVEAGTGYFKTSWMTNDITPDQAEVSLTKKGEGIAWGGLYWQYFEDLDKITFAETPLAINKKLFLKKNTDTGEKLSAITDQTTVNVGDLIRVRIEIKVDRDMEYVHMKDMRASGFEPINVLSHYKYQDGLGYYESTKDASTNFFFDHLRKGVYVFEYDLRANNAGDFSNGITTIQCMYAPEFTSHSEGVRVTINPGK